MKEMINICYQNSNIGVSIDMMSKYVDFESKELFYYSPEEIFSYCKGLTKRVCLRHDYGPYEFCIQLYHDDIEDTNYVK